jgi:Mg2+/Co2+ transporter CorB
MTICECAVLSARVFGGATYIRRVMGWVTDGCCVVIVVCAEVYPEVWAVMVADPVALLVTFARVYV